MKSKTARREFFRSSLLVTGGLWVSQRAAGALQAQTDSASEKDTAAISEKQFREGVLPHAELSLAASHHAVKKAADPRVKQFAGFELEETLALTEVLREMLTSPPRMEENSKSMLTKMEVLEGAGFDRAYIKAQLGTHIALRDLAAAYLSSPSDNSPQDIHGRHLAKMALATFREHTVLCQEIEKSLK